MVWGPSSSVGSSSRTGSGQSSALFAAWSRWCGQEGLDAGTNKSFTTALQNRGFDTTKSNGRMVWHGLGLVVNNGEAHE